MEKPGVSLLLGDRADFDREVHSLESHSTWSVWTADWHSSYSQQSSDQEQDRLSEAKI